MGRDVENPDDASANYIAQTLDRAAAGDEDAAEEVLDLFRSAVDHREIDGMTLAHRRLLQHIAECFWRYAQGTAPSIGRALGLEITRGVGQLKGSRKFNEDSYAAFLVLLQRHLGTADGAKHKVLELEQNANGRGPVSKRSLDTIYANYVGARSLEHDDLVSMLCPAHRKLFAKTLR